MHFRDDADSEYVSHLGVDRNGAEFIGNKLTHWHRDTKLYVLLQPDSTMAEIIKLISDNG